MRSVAGYTICCINSKTDSYVFDMCGDFACVKSYNFYVYVANIQCNLYIHCNEMIIKCS